jgi:hypothetical protein
VKATKYSQTIRKRPDREIIIAEWIQRMIEEADSRQLQAYGRIRRWGKIPEMEGWFRRVVLLPDGETVHNAFFDGGYKP